MIAPEQFRFGRWQLDGQRRTLCADGMPVPLNGRAFDLLALLVSRHGQAVTRDEIFAHVWPGITVGENNLTVQVSNLRKVLGDAGTDGAGLIVTVPRGYRFAGDVEALPAPPRQMLSPEQAGLRQFPAAPVVQVPFSRPRRWGLQAAISAGALILVLGAAALMWRPPPTAPRLSIAVLPFRGLGTDTTQTDLADALTDDLTTDLAHIPASTVIARESANAWRGKAATVQQIAHSLRVRYIVEGSIMKEESQYHVNAQLIDADTGAHLWASRFEAPQGRLGDVRDAIVRKLATALDFQITQIESARSFRDRPNDPDALDLFFRARAILDSNESLASVVQAQHLLEQAISKQPNFADALAELGTMLLSKVRNTEDPDGAQDIVRLHQVIARALELSPSNAKALAARSHSLAVDGDCTAAIYTAKTALDIEPSNVDAEAVLADCAREQGHLDDAIKHLHALLRLSPGSPKTRNRFLALGYIHMLQGDPAQAVIELRQATAGDMNEPSSESMTRAESAQLMLIAATVLQGDLTGAQAIYRTYKSVWPNRTVWRFGAMFSRADASFPGTKTMLTALIRAGMPLAANEHGSSVTGLDCRDEQFDDTPSSIPHSETLDTQEVVRHMRQNPSPLLFDLAEGSASPRNAIWHNSNVDPETPSDFVSRVAREHYPSTRNGEIVVMGDGRYGCGAARAVTRLVSDGYSNVKWYRGGEEAWAVSGNETIDRR